MAKGGLPPSKSWKGDWGANKVPYGKHYAGKDRKPARSGGGGGNSGCKSKARTFAIIGIGTLVTLSAIGWKIGEVIANG